MGKLKDSKNGKRSASTAWRLGLKTLNLVPAGIRQKILGGFLSFETQAALLPAAAMQNIIVHIDPTKVTRCIKNIKKYKASKDTFLKGGKWDKKGLAAIDDERPVVGDTLRQLFVEKLPFHFTDQYKLMIEVIRKGRRVYWCVHEKDVDSYFNILINAYESMKTQGYKTQDELIRTNRGAVRKNNGIKDEIQVYVTRESELVLGRGGTHRLIMARMLNLKKVPVLIRMVHFDWARKCFERIEGNDLERSLKYCLREFDLGAEIAETEFRLTKSGRKDERGQRVSSKPQDIL